MEPKAEVRNGYSCTLQLPQCSGPPPHGPNCPVLQSVLHTGPQAAPGGRELRKTPRMAALTHNTGHEQTPLCTAGRWVFQGFFIYVCCFVPLFTHPKNKTNLIWGGYSHFQLRNYCKNILELPQKLFTAESWSTPTPWWAWEPQNSSWALLLTL